MNKETLNDIINITNGNARVTMLEGYGGPFGATVIKDNVAISYASNSVLKDNDPTAHAEINAIRMACKYLGTYDLSGCELYTTCYPCPMCLSAIIWANIKEVYYANTAKDAANIGFKDEIIYEYIKENKKNIINLHHINSKEALQIFKNFKKAEDKKIY